MKVLRFSLRTLLYVSALLCLMLWLVPFAQKWLARRAVVKNVNQAFIALDSTDDLQQELIAAVRTGQTQQVDHLSRVKGHCYTYLGSVYYLGRIEVNVQGNGFTSPSKAKVRDDAVFVWPPGKWAQTADEALELLNDSL